MADTLLAKEPDGVILPPIMPEKTRGLIGTAAERGIPYVFFDTDLPDEKPLCAIVQDPFRGGYLAGRLMHLFASNPLADPLAGSNTLAVLDAHEDDYNITRRRDGFLRYAEEHGFPVLVRDYSDYRGTEISADEIADFLDGASGLTGIFITNCMAHRVAEAVERRMNVERQMNAERQVNAERREGGSRCLIVGYDLIPKNRELLREGRIDAIISQRPEEQGRQALLNLYRSVVLEQPILPKIEIPLDVYIKENVPLG
jgi:LacI family transcriptional regulator